MTARRSLLATLATLAACSEQPSRQFNTGDARAPAQDIVAADVPAPDVVTPEDRFDPLADRQAVRNNRDLFIAVPPTSADRFGGEVTTTNAPSIVYPEDGTILPPNLPLFEVHFLPGAGNDLFEVSFTGPVTNVRVYTRCNRVAEGCVLSLPETLFAEVGNAGRQSGGVELSIRATRDGGGPVSRTPTQRLGVTRTDLRGGVYWWVSSGSIVRYDFGLPNARSEMFIQGNAFNCVGCHALARDGSRIAVGRFIPAPAPTAIFNTLTREQTHPNPFGNNFGTFSPDNRLFLASDGMRMTLLNAMTIAEAPGLEANQRAGTMPDWSPSGGDVVFARPRTMLPLPIGSPGHDGATDLFLMGWNGSAFAAPRALITSNGENNYYPAFSPDGNWVLFNRANGGSSSNPNAQLWAVRSGGGEPVRLARADGPDGAGNSWPKWTPFVEEFGGEVTENLLWLTFTSHRPYGLRIRERRAQLWMAAFRPGMNGPDPSAPAFWVPFQNITEGNHIAQWVNNIQRQTCGTGMCANGEQCINGRCVAPPP